MTTRCDQSNSYCKHYIPDYNVVFKIVTPQKGDHYYGQKDSNNTLVFVLEGEVEFSYDDYINRHFVQGDLFFIPHATEMFGTALTDAKLLVLNFNSRTESLCDRCRLSEYNQLLSDIDYDFKPLRMTETLYQFSQLMERYIQQDIKCRFMHELKQKELFILLGAEFPKRDLIELFYPVSGENLDFKIRIMENYQHGFEVSELAKNFGMSYSPFLRKFKKEFGMPVQEWMLKQKAKHIKLRLSMPGTTVPDILREFGFSDLPHFIRFCHKYYQCTPRELVASLKSSKREQ